VLACLVVVVVAGGGTDLFVLLGPLRVVISQCDQCGSPNGTGVGTQCQGFGDVGTGANTTGNNELDLAVYAHFLQRFDCWTDSGQGWNTNVFNEHFLSRRGSTLHTINNDDV